MRKTCQYVILSYFKSGLSVLGDLESFHVEVYSEGETIRVEVLNVVVGNGRYAARGIPVASKACLTDGNSIWCSLWDRV